MSKKKNSKKVIKTSKNINDSKTKKMSKKENMSKQINSDNITYESKFDKVFNKYITYFTNSALYLLFFITIVLLLTYVLFILKISITIFHLPLAFIISTILFLIYKKKNLKIAIISIVISLVVFCCSTYVIGKVYDSTADGNTYHKLAVGAMKNGWNPVYSSVGDFNKKEGNPFDIYEDNVNINWVDHYAKGTETFAAVVYKSTGNIECGKVYNILWLYIALFLIFSLVKKMNINNLRSIIISTITVFNPIILVQLSNYYLDGVLALSLFIIILGCLLKQKDMSKEEIIENDLIIGMAIIWCINSKFTGLAFSGIFCCLIYLYQNIRNFIKHKDIFKNFLVKETIFYVIVVLLSVVLVGSGSYTKNLIDHGHPLYPLYGKGHVENMVMKEIPKSLQSKSSLEVFFISIFAKGENVAPSYADYINEPELKIPLTTSKEEINNYTVPDIRMGGFGPMFSGIFIISIILTIAIIIESIKKKDYDRLIPYIIVLLTMFCLITFLDGSYWARYIPYTYLIPIFTLIHYFQKDNLKKYMKVILIFIVALFAINSILIGSVQILSVRNSHKYISYRKELFRQYSKEHKKVKIRLSHHGVQGIQYNLDDWNITNYELTENDELQNDCYMFTY